MLSNLAVSFFFFVKPCFGSSGFVTIFSLCSFDPASYSVTRWRLHQVCDKFAPKKEIQRHWDGNPSQGFLAEKENWELPKLIQLLIPFTVFLVLLDLEPQSRLGMDWLGITIFSFISSKHCTPSFFVVLSAFLYQTFCYRMSNVNSWNVNNFQ